MAWMNLGMNLNPSNEQIMDYKTGWDDRSNFGSMNADFTKDYLSKDVSNMPVN